MQCLRVHAACCRLPSYTAVWLFVGVVHVLIQSFKCEACGLCLFRNNRGAARRCLPWSLGVVQLDRRVLKNIDDDGMLAGVVL